MRFMIIRKADAQSEAEMSAADGAEQLLHDMIAFHDEMAKAGILRGGDGLHPSKRGARIQFNDGKPTVIDGPFAETKELIAGYTLIEVPSMDDAIAWMKRWPVLDGGGNACLEIRRIYEHDEFGDALTPELRAKAEEVFR